MLISSDERWRWAGCGAAAIAVAAAGYVAVQRWWPHDSATEITVDEVLDRYRDDMAGAPAGPPPRTALPTPATTSALAVAPTSTAATAPTVAVTAAPVTTQPPAPPALPDPGVYVYTTRGREHVTALGGTEHVYPTQTLLTVTPTGCGVHLRWDLLAERYEEWNLCRGPDAIVLAPDGVQFHQFFGQSQTDLAVCRAAVPIAPAPPVGTSIDRDCTLAGEAWHPVWTAQAQGSAELDGASVATSEFHVTIDLDGDLPEHSTQRWSFAPNGLPVAIEFDMESVNPSPVGDVTYTETITATLVALEPLS